MSNTSSEILPAPDTLMIRCPVCGSDAGDTLGVAGAMDPSLKSTVVMSCERCRSVYLSPPPEPAPVADADPVYGPSIRKLKQGVRGNSRVFCAEPDPGSILALDPDGGRFDHILLPLALESAEDPGAMLAHAASLLEDGGHLDLLVGNNDSSCFAIFGGRHWSGYRYPQVRQTFRAEGIRTLAAGHGLQVKSVRNLSAPRAWLASVRNWLGDWGAGRFLTALLAGPWGLPWAVAVLIETIAVLRGRGSALVVYLHKEATP